MLETDRDLLDRFRRGDPAALRAVYEHFVDDIYGIARGGVRVTTKDGSVRLGDDLPEADAEAMVQDTFVKAFAEKARLSYDGLRPYGAYLSTIARNLMIDRGRRLAKERQYMVTGIELDTFQSEDSADAETRHEAQELFEVVETFAGTLRPPPSDVFRVRYQERQSLDAAAATLSMGIGALRRIDAELRVALLEHLREHGYLKNVSVRIGKRFLKRRGK